MSVRAIFRAISVEGAKPPFNVIHAKVFYPALEPLNDTERNSGILSPDTTPAPFPVVIMLNGVNCPPESYNWLALKLCAAGFVFVSFHWITDELPGGMHGLTPGIDIRYMNYENYEKGPTGSAIRPILDDLKKINADALLKDCLDLDKIYLGGHSAGGSVALMNTQYFPEVKAAFSYGSHTQGSTMMGFPPNYVCPISSETPILMMGGNQDGVITWSARRYGKSDEDSTVSLKQTFEKAIGGELGHRFLVIFDGANHFSFAHPKDEATGRPFLEDSPSEDEAGLRDLMGEMIIEFLKTQDIKNTDDPRIAIFQRK